MDNEAFEALLSGVQSLGGMAGVTGLVMGILLAQESPSTAQGLMAYLADLKRDMPEGELDWLREKTRVMIEGIERA